MTIVQARNAIVDGLEAHLGRPVVLSDQTAKMPEFPYGYYSILAPRISNHAFGLRWAEEGPDGTVRKRSEPVEATMSFTFCSQNRQAEEAEEGIEPEYIFGEDEALELSEKALGFFLLNGHCISTEYGDIVIRNVGNSVSRSSFQVEDTIRRYGFDVRIGFVRTDEMQAIIIQDPGHQPGVLKP